MSGYCTGPRPRRSQSVREVVRRFERGGRSESRNRVTRLSHGHFSNVEGVGAGVFEYKIDFGPGYRVYFGKDGDTLVILLGGGTKKRQRLNVETAQERSADYKRRK
jgi:putative addiction module killer protein